MFLAPVCADGYGDWDSVSQNLSSSLFSKEIESRGE